MLLKTLLIRRGQSLCLGKKPRGRECVHIFLRCLFRALRGTSLAGSAIGIENVHIRNIAITKLGKHNDEDTDCEYEVVEFSDRLDEDGLLFANDLYAYAILKPQ